MLVKITAVSTIAESKAAILARFFSTRTFCCIQGLQRLGRLERSSGALLRAIAGPFPISFNAGGGQRIQQSSIDGHSSSTGCHQVHSSTTVHYGGSKKAGGGNGFRNMLGEEGEIQWLGYQGEPKYPCSERGLLLKANRAKGGCAPGANLLSEGRLAANVRDCRTKASMRE